VFLIRFATVFLLVAALAACGDGNATSAASDGGAGGTGDTSSSTTTAGENAVLSSASASSVGTGAGGTNPDDPYGCMQGSPPQRPASIPEGYRPYTCWSQKPQCMLWIPEDPETMIDPLEWEPCAVGAPGGGGCRQMKRPWWNGLDTAIGATFPALPEIDRMGDKTLLHLARTAITGQGSDESWIEWDVYEVDGPALFGMRKHVPGEVNCRYQDYDVTDGVWVISPYGDDTESVFTTPLDGAIVVDVRSKAISLPYRDGGPAKSSWGAGSSGLLRYTGPDLFLHNLAVDTSITIHSAATDPLGATANTYQMVGDAVLWNAWTSSTVGIRAYDPEHGSRDLVRYLDDPTRGAGAAGTDGVDLVWMEGSGREPDNYTYPIRSIMTSPFTTDAAALEPRRLRTDLSESFGTPNDAYRVGCGWAAKSGGASRKDVQVVRLADGQGWNLLHTDQLWQPFVIGMTCDELFLLVQFRVDGVPQRSTIQRIRFDSLGEGEPAD